MKTLIIKLLAVFLFILTILFVGNVYIRNSLIPVFEHIAVFELTDKTFLRTEQNIDFMNIESIFIEKNQLRLHTTLHENEDAVFICENGNTDCYISSFIINASNQNEFLKKTMVKGYLPKDVKEIVINENLAKRLKLSIGDQLCIKSSVIYENVIISGIMKNFYGFPDYNREALFYCILNRGDNYSFSTLGSFFNFSYSDEDAFLSEAVAEKIAKLIRKNKTNSLALFIIFIFTFFISFLCFSKILMLKKFYYHLFVIGESRKTIRKKRIFAILQYSILILILIYFISLIGTGIFFFFFSFLALIFSTVINILGVNKCQF